MKILIRRQNESEWILVESAAYRNESTLQSILAESPGLISIEEVRPTAGPFVMAVPEFGVPIGYIDLLAFTANGDIAIIECKLAANAEIKRKVIGQVLEYAANLWEMTYEELDAAVCIRMGNNLSELVKTAVKDSNWDEEAFRAKVAATLESGNFILIIVVDEISDELIRIVRFINVCGNPAFEFAALEMRRFQAENTEMLVPRVFGSARSRKSKVDPTASGQWDETTFFGELRKRSGEDAYLAAQKILVWAKNQARVWWGKGKQSGSFVPILNHKEIIHQLFAVYTYGRVEVYFYWYALKPPFDSEVKRRELLEKLNQIEGIDIPGDAISRRPSISLVELAKQGTVDQFLEIFDWFVAEIKKS